MTHTPGPIMPDSDPISILCVDDEPLFLEAFQHLLEREGFQVTTVAGVSEALELLNSEYFDVISADYAMPEMDGLSFLREVRSRGCESLFIIVTARRLAHISIDAINAGADFYLQKGTDMTTEIRKLSAFIRKSVPEKIAGREIREWEKYYKSVVESQGEIILRINPDGTITFVNEAGVKFFNTPYEDLLDQNFFTRIPDEDRREVMAHLKDLSTINPEALFEHRIVDGSRKPDLRQWYYHGFFASGGALSQYQVSGRDISRIIRVGVKEPVQTGGPAEAPAAGPTAAVPEIPAQPDPQNEEVTNWSGLVDTIRTIDTPVFAVDRKGIIIAWNNAIAELTGVSPDVMLGRGDQEYAVPFYGKPVPMLIDQIIAPPGTVPVGLPSSIRKVGDTFIGEVENVKIQGKPMLLWGKGSPVFDSRGGLIAAVESITVGEPQPGKEVEEYLGGISSITLKVSGEGVGGAIAGAIGSATGGFGIYATNKRLFVIQNPELNPAGGSGGVQFGAFMMDELFGTTVDSRQKSIAELEKFRVFEAEKEQIDKLDLKKPVLLSGYLTITLKDKSSFRIYIDHKKAFGHIEQLIRLFSPENLKIE